MDDPSSHFRFEWDPDKARINAQKHGVTFDEAATVFDDPASITVTDDVHSTPLEERWFTIGRSGPGRLLTVVHIDIEDDLIRVISARRATRHETRDYLRISP